jgi:hypothetical protein
MNDVRPLISGRSGVRLTIRLSNKMTGRARGAPVRDRRIPAVHPAAEVLKKHQRRPGLGTE